VGAGAAVVTLRNIIHSAVAMMICFGSLAGMYALLGAPIVAAAQVLIYLGAISVLILFAIMLTQAIFTIDALPFEIISLLLLVAIIGAIFLARRPEEDERAN
jgi:NADH:ubiquinone oxidoreductase subunit 6 (subunit J)